MLLIALLLLGIGAIGIYAGTITAGDIAISYMIEGFIAILTGVGFVIARYKMRKR